ncbi:MAG: hypothetical protein MRJ93_05235 [Nitrososphaeraceae archaeon]|nr:hypothetical protein [Nitrososphaeraceae archaeon]
MNEKNEYQNYVIDKKPKSLEDLVLQMFDKYEEIDNLERQTLFKKIKEANGKGEHYAIYPDENPKPESDSEKLEREMKEDIHKNWFVLIKDRPDLQQKYDVKFVDK